MITRIYFYFNGGVVCHGERGENLTSENEAWYLPTLRDKLIRGQINDETIIRLPGVLHHKLGTLRKAFCDLPPSLPGATLGSVFFYVNGNLGSCTFKNIQVPAESRPWFLAYIREKISHGLADDRTILLWPDLGVSEVVASLRRLL